MAMPKELFPNTFESTKFFCPVLYEKILCCWLRHTTFFHLCCTATHQCASWA